VAYVLVRLAPVPARPRRLDIGVQHKIKSPKAIGMEVRIKEAAKAAAVAVVAASELASQPSALPTSGTIRIRTLDEWLRDEPDPLPMLVLSEKEEEEDFPLLRVKAAMATTERNAAETSPTGNDPQALSPPPSKCRHDPALRLRIAHIPFSQLVSERSFELPPRNTEFLILVQPAALESAVQFLSGRALSPPVQSSASSSSLPSIPSQRGGTTWNVNGAVLDTPDARRHLDQVLSNHFTKGRDPYQLWRPDSMVEQHLLPLLSEQLARRSRTTRRLDVWDLGSGVGRDVAFLARHLRLLAASSSDEDERRPSFRVIGLDQRYRPRDAATFRAFMRRQGVEDVTECRCVDLTVPKDRVSPFVSAMVEERPACIYAVRYWNRPLFEEVNRLAAPGTVVAITHFAKPTEDADWPFAHPKVCQRQVVGRAQDGALRFRIAHSLTGSVFRCRRSRRSMCFSVTSCAICSVKRGTFYAMAL
jgi:hypothetical protein